MSSSTDSTSRATRLRSRAIELLPLLRVEDQSKFLKKFRSESAQQAAHSTGELFVGVFLLKNGFRPHHEVEVQGQTPDWVLFREDNSIEALVDQFTFHQGAEIEGEQTLAMQTMTAWVGWVPDNTPRLYQKLLAKAEHYSTTAESVSAPLIVAVFSHFFAAVDRDELQEVLFRAYGGGIFEVCKQLSGVILSQESCGQYAFEYIPNPQALRPIHLVGCTV